MWKLWSVDSCICFYFNFQISILDDLVVNFKFVLFRSDLILPYFLPSIYFVIKVVRISTSQFCLYNFLMCLFSNFLIRGACGGNKSHAFLVKVLQLTQPTCCTSQLCLRLWSLIQEERQKWKSLKYLFLLMCLTDTMVCYGLAKHVFHIFGVSDSQFHMLLSSCFYYLYTVGYQILNFR